MQQAGRIFTTRFIMITMRGFAIYRTSKVDVCVGVLMGSCAGRRSPTITTSPLRGLLLFASRKRGRKRQRGHPNNAQVGTFVRSSDHGFTVYYNECQRRQTARVWFFLSYVCCLHPSLGGDPHTVWWKEQMGDDRVRWKAFFCKYETDACEKKLSIFKKILLSKSCQNISENRRSACSVWLLQRCASLSPTFVTNWQIVHCDGGHKAF